MFRLLDRALGQGSNLACIALRIFAICQTEKYAGRAVGGTRQRYFDGTGWSHENCLKTRRLPPPWLRPGVRRRGARRAASPRVLFPSGAVLGAFCLSQFTHKQTLPRNANQMKNTTKPNLFSCQRDHQGLRIRHEYPHLLLPASSARQLGGNRGGMDDFKLFFGGKFFLAVFPEKFTTL